MTARIRFFARFRELLGTDIPAPASPGTTLADLVREVARGKEEGYAALFDDNGSLRPHVIVMRNGKRIETADAEKAVVADGDEIAIFPPVSGG